MNLTWFIEGSAQPITGARQAYSLLEDGLPVAVWIHAGTVSEDNFTLDINADDVSIFDFNPVLPAGQTSHRFTAFNPVVLRADSTITLDVDSAGALADYPHNVTITLELE